MTRLSYLARHPRRTLATLGLVLAAVAVAVGSGANFTASSANPSNTFAAGTLSLVNTPSNSAILTVANMKPGDPATTGTVDTENTGSLAGTVTLSTSSLVDTDAADTPVATNKLSGKLNLIVNDCGLFTGATPPSCSSPTEKYNGTIAGLTGADLGSYAAGAKHRYQFVVSFPSGTPAADNPYQGRKTSVTFNWDAA